LFQGNGGQKVAITPKRGLYPVQITVPDEVIDLLLAREYDLIRADKASVAHALETFLADAVLEGA
jgi:hypothetical protein